MRATKTKKLTLMAFFLAIELLLLFTPLGFLPLGVISITLMHIPVIIIAITMGKKEGAMLGFVFGLCSLLNATFKPTLTSFCFSPFITIGGTSGNLSSILIAFIPRILLGFLAGYIYEVLAKKKVNEHVSIASAALVGSLTNTILVLGGIYIFFGAQYAAAIGVSFEVLFTALLAIITSNGIAEAIAACLLALGVCKALKPYRKKW